MARLKEKVALITGAGRGIGREIARAMAAEGARVAVVSRTEKELLETRRLITEAGGTAIAVPADVTAPEMVAKAVERIGRELGPIDIVMNNAGSFNAIGPVVEVDPDLWWRDVTINVLGPFTVCRAVLPQMIARGSGRVLNMIGGGTATPFPYGSGYGSSKAALMRFTESLDREVYDAGIIVFAMGPGLVKTAMTELQLTTAEGRRWMTRIKEMFDTGRDVPPTRAAALAVELASGRMDRLHGRAFGVQDDLDAVLGEADRIIAQDLKTLRLV